MSVINVEHISKLYGDKMILEDLSCSVDEGDKIGIIGINGTGKSTLLRIIAGEEEADEGKIIFSNGMTIGWMGQNPEFDEESSILKYVCEGKKIEDDYGYESDAKAMLTVLELENFDEKIKNLSGGQKKRAALCKVLLQKPDILILDEPTNHLDNKMSDWLENYLKSFRGVLLMVTHDRYFLDKVTNHIWEVEGGKVYYYDENYSGYLERKAEREERELASERKRQSILRSVAISRSFVGSSSIKTFGDCISTFKRYNLLLSPPEILAIGVYCISELKRKRSNIFDALTSPSEVRTYSAASLM